MHFHYVDIGTSDFDTSLDQKTKFQNVLLVEPLDFYLDNLPNGKRIYKECSAISNHNGIERIYFVPPDVRKEKNFPLCVKGQNKLLEPHKSTHRVYQISKSVNVLTFDTLCKKYKIKSIGRLKIDTEGHEVYILPGVIERIKKGMKIQRVQFEYSQFKEHKTVLDSYIKELESLGYVIKLLQSDCILDKEKK